MLYNSETYRALIVSSSDKGKYYFKNTLLDAHHLFQTQLISDSQEARREVLNTVYDIVIINTPLSDESGIDLAIHIATQTKSVVIMIVKAESYEDMYQRVQSYGILLVCKPINKLLLLQTIEMAITSIDHMKKYEKELSNLKQKLEELRYISKAKCLLMENEHLSEEDAHKYLEKEAMDTRQKRVTVAIEIIRRYM